MTIPEGVTSIGERAFYGCNSISSVTIPSSVDIIGKWAFFADGITALYISDLTAWLKVSMLSTIFKKSIHLYLNNKEVKDLVIPNSVTSINDYVLCFFGSLTSVTIPNSVKSIGEYAFFACSGLKEVHSEIKEPFDIDSGVFQYQHWNDEQTSFDLDFTNATLYVPKGTKSKYQAKEGWKSFKTIKEEGEPETVDPTAITISPSSKTINVGESFQASYTLTPSNATTTVTWSSDNTNIATVSSSGVVKGIKAGSTYINVKTANGKTDYFKVTVKEVTVDPTAITISPSSKTINVGESFQASYTLTPSNATTTVTWSSDNTNIATVSSSGVVKGIKAGSTYINVKTANGKTDWFKVTVEESPKLQLSASPSGGEVEKGTIVKLVAKANGSTVSADIYYTTNGTTPTKSSTKYTSSGIVINSDRTIKAIAYKDGYEASDVLTAKYTINNSVTVPTDISISLPSNLIMVGDSVEATYTLIPSDAATTVTWSSEDSEIAEVKASDNSCTITGKTFGETTINAKTSNGKTASCKVSVFVIEGSSFVFPTEIEPSSATIHVGDSIKLFPSFSDFDFSYYSWTSEDSNIAKTNSSGNRLAVAFGSGSFDSTGTGVVVGVMPGKTIITGRFHNGASLIGGRLSFMGSCEITVMESMSIESMKIDSEIIQPVFSLSGQRLSAPRFYLCTHGTRVVQV